MEDDDLNDLSADGSVKPPRAYRPKLSRTTDRVLALTGVGLACSAAFFPWYVFFNPEKFGLSVAPMDHTRDLPIATPRNVFSVSPLAMVARNPDQQKLPADVDPQTTATISDTGKIPQQNRPDALQQPMPGNAFRLLHVANGRALIEDDSGMFMVQIGSVLPDNSRLATIEQRNGKWVIVTSSGQIYQNEQ